MFFRMLYDTKLAQASYLIGCQKTGEAMVIDPQRDVDRYIETAAAEGLRLVAATETHIHADFLSGVRELAERGIHAYLSHEGGRDWEYQWLEEKAGVGNYAFTLLKDGDTFAIGNIEFQAVHTQGHTPEHMSFLITDRGGGIDAPMGIATGDFVFVGDVGRPDLLETAAGVAGAKETSARALFQSVQQFQTLPDYLQLWPGHGSGSACGKALGAVPQSTVGYEKRFNPAVALASNEKSFVESVLHGQPAPPLYFARMKKENRDGPPLLGKIPRPRPIPDDQLADFPQKKAVILDTRPWSDFVQGHLEGALFTPLNKAFTTVAGSYVMPDTDIYLVVEENRVREAVTDLIRIGLDRVVGHVSPDRLLSQPELLVSTPHRPMVDIKEMAGPTAVILDVRNTVEFAAGHLPDALNVAHTRLLAHLDDLPRDKSILVHCQSGVRSCYATALLERHGFDAVQMDGGFLDWQEVSGKVVQD